MDKCGSGEETSIARFVVVVDTAFKLPVAQGNAFEEGGLAGSYQGVSADEIGKL